MNRKHIGSALLAILLTASAVAGETTAPRPVVNINTATVEQLSYLPGVGAVLAQRIIDYRGHVHSAGGYATVTEMMDVKGIGNGKKFRAIRDFCVIAGPTTAKEKIRVTPPAAR